MAENKTIQLDVETNLGSLRSQLRAAQQEVAILSEKFGATSTEAANAARKAAELKDRIQDAKALTDAFNPDAKFNALSASIGGALNGFQAFEGALGVMGVESEDLQKQLLKVQSAMALSQGIQGLLEAKDSFIALGSVIKSSVVSAFTTLRGAIISTGIGALVVTIGYLVNSFIEASEASKTAAEEQKKYNEQLQKHNELAREANETGIGGNKEKEREIELLKARGATTKQIYDAEIKLINDKIKAEESLRDAGGYEEQQKSIQNILELRHKAKLLEIEYNNEIKKQREEEKKKRKEDRENAKKERDENAKKALEEDANNAEKIYQEQLKLQQEALQKEKDLQNLKRSLIKDERLKELADLQASYQSKFELAKGDNELTKQLGEQLLEDRKKINKKYIDLEKEKSDKQIALEKDVRDSKIQIAQDSLALISNITTLFGQRNEKEAKKAFQVDKAAKLASATISGIEGTINAYTTAQKSPITALFPAYPAIQAGLAGAFAAVNIAKISQTQFQGGNNNIDSSNAPMGGASQSMTPQFNVVGGNQTSQLLQGLSMQPLKAYVVASDITTAQMLEQKAIKTSVL